MSIHFYYAGNQPLDRIDTWDPEVDSMRFPDGEGHAFFQLYLALKKSGVDATLGKQIPENAKTVVVFKKAKLGLGDQFRLLKALLGFKFRVPVVLVAADCKSGRMNVFMHHVEIVPNPLKEIVRSDIFIPLFPQNALIKRNGWNGVVGLYCHSKNYPAHLLDDGFLEQLRARGIVLHVVFLDSDQREKMTDFSGISLSLCIRSGHESDPGRKPPTKLINAWNAEVIPVIDQEPGYLSIGSPGKDCILLNIDHVNRPSEAKRDLLNIFERFQDYAVAEPMLKQIHQRSIEFSRQAILGKYIQLFDGLARSLKRNSAGYRLMLCLAFLCMPVVKLCHRDSSWFERYRMDVSQL